MPNLPKLKPTRTARIVTDVFGGYDHHLKGADGSWYEQTNISCDAYPVFSTRKKRGTVRTLTAPGGLIEKDALCYVDNGTLYVNGLATNLTGLTSGEKQLVSMGAYVCVFPDKKYYNTKNSSDYGSMEADYTSVGDIVYTLCRSDGSAFNGVEVGSTEPEEGSVEIWINTGTGGASVAMSWSASYGGWVELDTVYTKLTFASQGQIPALFKEYDGVEISGASQENINGNKILYAIGGVAGSESDWIVVVGLLESTVTQESGAVRIQRKVPALDYVCEAQNRLWGCYYGHSGGQNLNEIYCCALGDFKNWSQYMGLSTDSWTASVGSDGQWTAAVNYLGSPVFFKENRIHQVEISSVGAHQLRETVCRGVQKGSSKSLVVVNETLLYKSRTDVCAWQGGFPESVSPQLGDVRYGSAVAGAYGTKYYISMKDGANAWHLFAYDLEKHLWCREDSLHVSSFARVDDELYAVDASTNALLALNGTTGTAEGSVAWSAETGILTYEYPDQKYISRYNVRLKMAAGATAKIYLEYDSSGTWIDKGTVQADHGTVTLPIRPRRCDHLRMKISGTGHAEILSIARILEVGSDVV